MYQISLTVRAGVAGAHAYLAVSDINDVGETAALASARCTVENGPGGLEEGDLFVLLDQAFTALRVMARPVEQQSYETYENGIGSMAGGGVVGSSNEPPKEPI